ncbi:MAG: hypothetical protein WCK21_04345 [Actinomycetota bacterium]
MSRPGARAALVLGSLAAAGVGWVGARQYFEDGAGNAATAGAGIDLYDCPMAGALSIGQVHPGDRVWLIGVTGRRWAVIRDQDQPDRPAWMPLALVDTRADTGDLPELGCADAVDLAGAAPTVSTAPPTSLGSRTTVAGSTTTSSSTTISGSTTSTKVVTDHDGPIVTITADHTALVVTPPVGACSTLTVTVVLDDPTLPLAVVSAEATWTGKSGPREKALTPVGKSFTLAVPSTDGPTGTATQLTITVVAKDGLNNTSIATLPITLKASGGC